ncbi:MAG: 3-dehydroquinate synthase [Alphaproteobacteria bacterium]|nr:3-dehydroquinate synthase [Alphaproteobacteria bacterium SS10]
MSDAPLRTVHVDLAGRSYDIDIGQGLLAQAGAKLTEMFGNRILIPVVDAALTDTHLATLITSLDEAGANYAEPVVVPSGEASKGWDGFSKTVEALLDRGVDRQSVVLALGGGVIGDLAGYAAASTMRGLDFVQIPTTLLAQVDSAVGGKTGINTRHGKNLVGAFHQPRHVLIDTDTLATLPHREMRAGYAEVLKYGLLGDAEFFDWLEANGQAVLDRDAEPLTEAIARSCAAKAAIVAADEREAGQRALLNLGHTFAHALEAEAGYDGSLLHGEAVSIGMALAYRLSTALGYSEAAHIDRVEAHLSGHDMPVLPFTGNWRRALSADRLLNHMRLDKKAEGGRLTFILARGIGDAFVSRDVDEAAVTPILDEFLARIAAAA